MTDVICEKCGRNMVIKSGRFGKFLACPGFPECTNTKPCLLYTSFILIIIAVVILVTVFPQVVYFLPNLVAS